MRTIDLARARRSALWCAAVLSVGLVGACGEASRPHPEGRPASNATNELQRFDSLDEMLAASDMVVVGQVGSIEAGRIVGGRGGPVPEDEARPWEDPVTATGGLRLNAVDLEIERVLHRSGTAEDALRDRSVLLEEVAGRATGGVASRIGDRGVYFLHLKDDPGTRAFRLVSGQGRFLDVDGTVVSGSDDAWSRAYERATFPQLVEAVVEAGARRR